MKYIVIVFVLLSNVGSLFAQNIESLYECIYKYTVSGQDENNENFNDVGYCMLQIGNGIGKFYDYSSFQTDSVRQANCPERIVNAYKLREQRNVSFFDQVIYQNKRRYAKTNQFHLIPPTYVVPSDAKMFQCHYTLCAYICQEPCNKHTLTKR